MAKNWLQGVRDYYDVVVIGSGLGGLTGANLLARQGRSVLLLEHHYQFGGLATWFRRPGGHIFDISLHGFPAGMIKSCRRYWNPAIAQSIVQLKGIRFSNPQYDLWTTFDREDFTRLLTGRFGLPASHVESFFARLREMNFYDDHRQTTGELFEEFFPGRDDVHRLLMEPIAYANGSGLDDPAITYGIVFSNFMSKGVYTFQGGTDLLVGRMEEELRHNGVDLRKCSLAEKILIETKQGTPEVTGVEARSLNSAGPQPRRVIRCRAVLSNANLINTISQLAGEEHFTPEFVQQVRAVRLNSSSCQVYFGLRPGAVLPRLGDLIFTSDAPHFSMAELTSRRTTSRTFSIYYPETRPQASPPRYSIVASLNAQWKDWNSLSESEYEAEKRRLMSESLTVLERFVPGIGAQVSHCEAATPRTINRYTRHPGGTSFGTKFEGLKVSRDLPTQVRGLHHAGSVGIIMSGWLGAINYGVIVANQIDSQLAVRPGNPS